MVLNGSSTHPNPWTPPTEYEKSLGLTHVPRIYHGYPSGTSIGPPIPSRWVDGSLAYRMAVAFKDGACIGILISAWDRYTISRQPTTSASVARALYFTGPAIAATVSFTTSREFFSRYFEDRYHPVPTLGASAVAGSILGVAYKSTRLGVRATGFIGFATALHIYLGRQGYHNFGLPGSTLERKYNNPSHYFIWNESDPFYRFLFGKSTNILRPTEDVPTWKKFEEKQTEEE